MDPILLAFLVDAIRRHCDAPYRANIDASDWALRVYEDYVADSYQPGSCAPQLYTLTLSQRCSALEQRAAALLGFELECDTLLRFDVEECPELFLKAFARRAAELQPEILDHDLQALLRIDCLRGWCGLAEHELRESVTEASLATYTEFHAALQEAFPDERSRLGPSLARVLDHECSTLAEGEELRGICRRLRQTIRLAGYDVQTDLSSPSG